MIKVLLGSLLFLVSTSLLAASTGATVETLANNVIVEINEIPDLLSAIAYVCGIALGVKAVLKFKEHNESKGQVKMAVPVVLLVASALLLALPEFLDIGIEAIGYNQASQKNFTYKY